VSETPRSERCRIVALVSGRGSNLQSLLDAIPSRIPANVVAVISNEPGAPALQRAAAAGAAAITVCHRDFPDRDAFDQALISTIDPLAPDLIVLAGFMRILTAEFVRHYRGRLLNIHPSLLPKFPGLDTHQRAIEAGEAEHGATVHFVTEQLDGGPIVLQGRVRVDADDSADSLARRVLAMEHRIYPQTVQWFAQGRLRLCGDTALLDSEPAYPNASISDF
jgi:phosphoribosylglycinamide formyltransferase-1